MKWGVSFRLIQIRWRGRNANERQWELLQVVAGRERATPVLRKTPGYAGGCLFVVYKKFVAADPKRAAVLPFMQVLALFIKRLKAEECFYLFERSEL